MTNAADEAKWSIFTEAIMAGASTVAAATKAGISEAQAYRVMQGKVPNSPGTRMLREARSERGEGGVIPLHRLSKRAKHGVEDFGYFRRTYFGRIQTPWQDDAAHRIVEHLESEEKVFVVINAPPGGGKSTTFTHDIPAWLTVRNRTLRGLMGSESQGIADTYVRRLKRTFERTVPWKADEEKMRRGMELDAVATLTEDFGIFQPMDRGRWRDGELLVAQHGDQGIGDKESTWTAYGFDAGYLGMRFDFVMWDDLVTKKNMRTEEGRQKIIELWDDIAETRLEPGGLLVLQGQRLAANDLYRYCLDKTDGVFLDEDGYELTDVAAPKKYQHIVYKAHDDSKCTQAHPKGMPPWPQSCLLDPQRLSWRELRSKMQTSETRFLTVYQQEDLDPKTALVQKVWASGGMGADGVEYPGVWDMERVRGQIPPGLAGRNLNIVTVDPSGEKMWGVIRWCYNHAGDQDYLIDIYRGRMGANELLDRDPVLGFTGLLERWWQESAAAGQPITHLVVEINAAQRYLTQYNHFQDWKRLRGVVLIPHTTGRLKTDEERGVESLIPSRFKHGNLRLPGSMAQDSRLDAMKLVTEATNWPHASTSDLVMSYWFFRHNLPKLRPLEIPPLHSDRPSWLKAGNL